MLRSEFVTEIDEMLDTLVVLDLVAYEHGEDKWPNCTGNLSGARRMLEAARASAMLGPEEEED